MAFGFSRIQPRALGWQTTDNQTTTAFVFHAVIVSLDPLAHRLTDVPRGVVPNQEPRAFPLHGEVGQEPCEKRTGHATDWASRAKAQKHVGQCWKIESLTCNRLDSRIGGGDFLVHDAQGLVVTPRMERWLLATPSGITGKPKCDVGILFGQADQPFT